MHAVEDEFVALSGTGIASSGRCFARVYSTCNYIIYFISDYSSTARHAPPKKNRGSIGCNPCAVDSSSSSSSSREIDDPLRDPVIGWQHRGRLSVLSLSPSDDGVAAACLRWQPPFGSGTIPPRTANENNNTGDIYPFGPMHRSPYPPCY